MLTDTRHYRILLPLNSLFRPATMCYVGSLAKVTLNSQIDKLLPAPQPTCEGLNRHLILNKGGISHRTRLGVQSENKQI